MSLKPTLRKDGHHHATILVGFYPDADMAVQALAAHADREGWDLDEIRVTKAATERILHDAYRNHGEGAEQHFVDELQFAGDEKRTGKELLAWARLTIGQLWPEWKEA